MEMGELGVGKQLDGRAIEAVHPRHPQAVKVGDRHLLCDFDGGVRNEVTLIQLREMPVHSEMSDRWREEKDAPVLRGSHVKCI